LAKRSPVHLEEEFEASYPRVRLEIFLVLARAIKKVVPDLIAADGTNWHEVMRVMAETIEQQLPNMKVASDIKKIWAQLIANATVVDLGPKVKRVLDQAWSDIASIQSTGRHRAFTENERVLLRRELYAAMNLKLRIWRQYGANALRNFVSCLDCITATRNKELARAAVKTSCTVPAFPRIHADPPENCVFQDALAWTPIKKAFANGAIDSGAHTAILGAIRICLPLLR
jgi:hypothetical protein